MSYVIDLDTPPRDGGETIAAGVRRAATEQIDKALDTLDADDEERAERVHDVRKRMKKVRAALRLVRDGIGEDVFDHENHACRDTARLLADARDGKVHLDTLDALRKHYGDSLKRNAFSAIKESLETRRDEVNRQLIEAGTLDEVAERIRTVRARVPDWPIPHDGFDTARDGLKRVYKRGWKGLPNAYDDGSAEAFHEWRKRAKYLWYHLRLLGPLWPAVLDAWAGETHTLANILGDDHDLAELRTAVAEGDVTEERDTLFALIERRHADLRAAAHPLGRRLYVEKPAVFADRIAAYWSIRHDVD